MRLTERQKFLLVHLRMNIEAFEGCHEHQQWSNMFWHQKTLKGLETKKIIKIIPHPNSKDYRAGKFILTELGIKEMWIATDNSKDATPPKDK